MQAIQSQDRWRGTLANKVEEGLLELTSAYSCLKFRLLKER